MLSDSHDGRVWSPQVLQKQFNNGKSKGQVFARSHDGLTFAKNHMAQKKTNITTIWTSPINWKGPSSSKPSLLGFQPLAFRMDRGKAIPECTSHLFQRAWQDLSSIHRLYDLNDRQRWLKGTLFWHWFQLTPGAFRSCALPVGHEFH